MKECHWFLIKKAIWYVPNCQIYEYYVIFVNFQAGVSALFFYYFQAGVSALLAVLPVSVLYIEKKNQNKYYVIFRKFNTSNSFTYDMPALPAT